MLGGLAESFAIELGPWGQSGRTSLLDGRFWTELGGIWAEGLDILVGFAEWDRTGVSGEQDNIASAALFITTDDAAFITGAALPVHGGMSEGLSGVAAVPVG